MLFLTKIVACNVLLISCFSKLLLHKLSTIQMRFQQYQLVFICDVKHLKLNGYNFNPHKNSKIKINAQA